MSSINYGALAGGESTQPPNGMHRAYLMRARLQTGAQDFIVTEWQAGPYWWETLYGFTPQRLQFTQDALDGLGIDRAKITDDDALEDALALAQGSEYRVRVEVNGRFTNTYVEGAAVAGQPSFDSRPPATGFVTDGPRMTRGQEALAGLGAQRSFDADIPADTAGLPEPGADTHEPAVVGGGAPPVDLTDEELNDIFR